MVKDDNELKFIKEDGLLISTNKYYIPFLGNYIEIWCNTFNDKIPTKKCISILKKFTKNDLKMTMDLINGLNNYREKLIKENRIIKTSKTIKNINEIKFTNLVLPYQSRTKEKFILLYGETNWKIKNSKYTVEIEILFTNNIIEIIQESKSLWTMIGWNYDYNFNGKIIMGIKNNGVRTNGT